MSTNKAKSFQPAVAAKLKTYVYRLIDPRNGETFYVGKGKGNRVFTHIRGKDGLEDEIDNKLRNNKGVRPLNFLRGHILCFCPRSATSGSLPSAS